ncbi:MFS transporter [Bradyrhizobium sp.]|jgi:MFS family permease|uniref:MFS transporter n=1 Tax=Bradyrhizobium sp. TaxID=376 RepID=UPI003C33C14B
MTIAAAQPLNASVLPSDQSLRALDGVNLFVAGVLAGFGPFVAVFLGDQGWSQEKIGLVLSAGGIAGLLTQLPSGELLDVVRSKRFLVGLGTIMVGLGALIIALWPTFTPVSVALVLQGITGGFLGPAIASISLGLVGHDLLGERLGRNQRFKSIGSLAAAGILGVVGYFLSNRDIFFTTAVLVLPALVALVRIRADDIHFGRSVGAPDHHHSARPPRIRRRAFWRNRYLLIFAGCLFMFQMVDASILPLIGGTLGHAEGSRSALIMSGLVIVPQIIVAVMAPWAGRHANSWGRRPLLLLGFGVLPIRALLFTVVADPMLLLAVQLLDGVSGTVLGVLQALVIADLTSGTGRFNLAQGLVGVTSGIGASVSTTLSGVITASFGRAAGFLALTLTGLAAVAMVWLFMPETKPSGR